MSFDSSSFRMSTYVVGFLDPRPSRSLNFAPMCYSSTSQIAATSPFFIRDQAFTWLGNGAFTGVAGQLHYVHQGGNTFVEGDLNGDSVADIFINLTGTINLVAGDFVL